jgi:DNA repair protein RadC
MGRLRNQTHETFIAVYLDTKNRVMAVRQISEGSLTCAVVHPREVYAPAVVLHAAAILVAHNHPSGDPRPSDEDKELTRALSRSGDLLGIQFLDHVVIGDGRYYSFKEHHEI